MGPSQGFCGHAEREESQAIKPTNGPLHHRNSRPRMGPPCTSTPNHRKHFFPLPLAFVSGQQIRIRALNKRGDLALKSDEQRQDSVIHWGIGWGGASNLGGVPQPVCSCSLISPHPSDCPTLIFDSVPLGGSTVFVTLCMWSLSTQLE